MFGCFGGKVIKLHREGIIDVFGTCKESLVEFYKSQGFKTAFIQNTVRLDENIKSEILKVKRNAESDNIFIGLYAAALSTAISYFTMMVYRHFDLKKHLTITYERGLFIKTLLMFALTIILYYQRNMILNVVNLVVVCIYAFVMNKEFLFNSYKTVINKIRRN